MTDFNITEFEVNSQELIVNNNYYEGINEGIVCFIVFIAFLRFWIF
jgi:hypothetical protein